MHFIDLAAQQERIRPQIDEAIKRVLDHGQYIMGPEVGELEDRLAKYVGVKHAIGCSSGTDALLLALLAYGVGPGDAVFTTPFTFFASCETIALTGATPVFVDIDPKTFNMDPQKLADAVANFDGQSPADGTPLSPKGIMPVDLFGLPADYDAIMATADEYGLFVLEDAAQAFGAGYKGRKAPGLAHVGATSFFPAKPLGCYGDGGAIFTDDDDLAGRIRSLLVHGKGIDKYNNIRIGLNARLDTIQAAVLIEKLKIFPEEMDRRQSLAEAYTDALSLPGCGITVPFVPDHSRSAWAQYTIRCEQRDAVQEKLKTLGVPSVVYYQNPAHLLDALSYLGYAAGSFPAAEEACRSVLSLPFFPYLQNEQSAKVSKALLSTMAHFGTRKD